MRKKLFTFLLALVTSVGLSWATEGALSGAFAINGDGDYIAFSKGNLQYHCTNHVWQFATNQYDIIGGDNANISDSYDGWVDLFGYGTGNNPTLVNTSYGDYSTFTDWGVNAISNGGNEANLWRTLTKDEWVYIFNSRTKASQKYGMATVANLPGIILLPDVYAGPAINTDHDAWANNVISSSEWAAYEAAGAVFLPAAGYRSGTTMDNVGSYGFYWSSTPDDAMHSYKFSLDKYVVSQGYGLRYEGLSVRLVQATQAPEPVEGVIVIETDKQQTSYTESTVTISCAAIGDSDGFSVSIYGDKTATITNSDASKIISKIELVPGYSESYHSYVRANGGTPASSSESLITFTNVNSNNVTLSITNEYIQIKEVRITLADNDDPTPDPTPNPSGECGAQGDNLLWELNTSTGVLTITGSGAMNDWPDDTNLPWYDNRLDITSVVLPSGITSLGTKAFRGCNNLASINMTENYPAGLTAINQEAFCNTKLTSVTIPESVVTIGQDAFYLSQAITDVYCYADPNNLTWTDFYCDDFNKTPAKSTQCHVKDCYLAVYNSKWNTSSQSTDVNVTFVGDLPGDCGAPTPTPSGDKLPGVFSVSGTKAVCFSKGNLQYNSGTQAWQFAENQWDYIGNAAGNKAITVDGIPDNSGIVDLFGWVGASSSWITGSTQQYGISTSTTNNDYGNVYGEALKQDWGNTMGSDWRTLSKDEWNYLLTERANAANLRTLATVNDKTGLILMPDGWTASGVSLTVTKENYTDNTIGSSDWATLAGQGCVFLPAAGSRNGNWVMSAGTKGHYWSSTSRPDGASLNSFKLVFMADDVDPTDYTNRYTGLSVRLVSETAPTPTPTPTPSDEQVPTNEDPENPSYHYSTFFHSTQNYKLTNDGTQAFIADLSNNDLVLTEIANGTQVIPANTAVILRKTGSADPVVLTPTEENGVSVNPDDNSLEGVDAITAVTSIDGLTTTNCYVLSGTNEYGVGFYRINSDNLKAHKAYVKYAGLQTNAPRRMRFVFNQEQVATGVENVQGDKVQSTKVLRDGQLVIIRNGVEYNAAGQMIK